LFVVTAGDFEDVAVEFVAEGVSRDFLANLRSMRMPLGGWKQSVSYPLVHECAQTTLVFDFDELLAAIGRIGDLKTMSAYPSTLQL
jgi:hypothetical protein